MCLKSEITFYEIHFYRFQFQWKVKRPLPPRNTLLVRGCHNGVMHIRLAVTADYIEIRVLYIVYHLNCELTRD